MRAGAVVRARIDQRVKEEASATLGAVVSDAARMMLMRTAAEKALPFDPLLPNAKTIRALKAAQQADPKGADDLMSI